MVKEISQSQYHCVTGLLTLAAHLLKQLNEIEQSLGEVVGVEDEGYGYFGHVSDAVYSGEVEPKELLKKLEIKIQKGIKKGV